MPLSIKIEIVFEYSIVRGGDKVRILVREGSVFGFVRIPSWLWPAAIQFPLVLSTETLTLIPDTASLHYGGR